MQFISEIINSRWIENRADNKHILSENELKNLQNELFRIYKDLKKVCDIHRISLIFTGGSALGAVRHKDFIPWDDDLDLAMIRCDFEKFKLIFNKELGEKYILYAPNYIEPAKNRFAKVFSRNGKIMLDDGKSYIVDLSVDIFPLEFTPNNSLKRMIKGIYCNVFMFCVGKIDIYHNKDINYDKLKSWNEKMVYGLFIFIGKLFSVRKKEKWYDILDNYLSSNKIKSKFVNIPTGRKHYFGEMMLYDDFFPLAEKNFHGEKVKIAKNYDLALRNLYGDYMKIPSVEERESHGIKIQNVYNK